jgi:hypothetical protein
MFRVMEPSYFFYLVLPLGILVFCLVGLTVYYARKGEDEYEKEVKKLRGLLFSGKIDTKTFVNLKGKTNCVKDFQSESKRLLELLSEGKIDEESYTRLRQVLEKSFRDKIGELDEAEELEKKPFQASKF